MKTMITGLLSLMVSGIVNGAEEIPYLAKEYDPARWPVAILKLSTAATLKDVFDSGLRPYRFPYLERTTLELKHLNLSIHLGSGKKLPPIPAEMMRIKPFSDGEIAIIEGFTPKMTLEQVRCAKILDQKQTNNQN